MLFFPLFSSLPKKEGRRKGKKISETGLKKVFFRFFPKEKKEE
jgi:hypothetical protein